MTRVLITGGTGFIGSHLARQLAERGDEVDLLDDLSRGKLDPDMEELLARPGVQLLERDLLAAGALDGLDGGYEVVFHLAAIVGVANVLRAPFRVLHENVALLTPVLKFAASQPGLRRLVFASTSEVYAGTLESSQLPVPTPETAMLVVSEMRNARTAYMLSKLYGEALCHQSGLPVTIVRPHNVFGPRMGMAHVIPELLQRAHAAPDGGSLEVFSVEHRRTFCYVSDAVEMITRAAREPAGAGETLNIGTQSPEISIGELAEIVLEVVGRDLVLVPAPPHPGSPARRCPDMTKTTELTEWTARVTLAQGVRSTYDWYQGNVFD